MKVGVLAIALSVAPVAASADEAVFDWQGAYAGITLGAARGIFDFPDLIFSPLSEPYHLEASGLSGGLHAGWNAQVGSVVFGVEADALLARVVGRETGSFSFGPDRLDYRFGTSVDWLSTFRARAGLAHGRTLVFATGGLALGGVRDFMTLTVNHLGSQSVSLRSTETGWSAGGGIEHALTDRVSVSFDYLFVDLGEREICTCGPSLLPPFRTSFHTARLGFGFHF